MSTQPLSSDRRAMLNVLLAVTGQSIADAARHVDVQDRTMRRWVNDPGEEIPDDVIEDFMRLHREIEEVADTLRQAAVLELPGEGVLTKIDAMGLTPSAYRMAVARAWSIGKLVVFE